MSTPQKSAASSTRAPKRSRGGAPEGRKDSRLLREVVSRAEGAARAEKAKLAPKGGGRKGGGRKAPSEASGSKAARRASSGKSSGSPGGGRGFWSSRNWWLSAAALGIVIYGIVGVLDVGSGALDGRLRAGDVLVVEVVSARFSAPSTGRLVEVRQRGEEVPRALGLVVAVDGDEVVWAGGRLKVNGEEAALPGDLGRLGGRSRVKGRGRRIARTPPSLGLPGGGRLEVPRDHIYVTVDGGGQVHGRVIPLGDVAGVALLAVGGGQGWAARLPRWVY